MSVKRWGFPSPYTECVPTTSRYVRMGAIAVALLFTSPARASQPAAGRGQACEPAAPSVRFAVIGDYGADNANERAVALLVKSWAPDFVITVGDNSYPDAATAQAVDRNIGQYYWEYIYPYIGAYTVSLGGVAPATVNRFFPSLGNHDWANTTDAAPYLAAFTLPGNERYYSHRHGPVELFALDSDTAEPDGVSSTSSQADWLRGSLAGSSAPWRLVYFHHPSYSSGPHGSSAWMQWDFKGMGASLVLNGHDHDYERLVDNGLTYIVAGTGGQSLYNIANPLPTSVAHVDTAFGALLVQANDAGMVSEFRNTSDTVLDIATFGCAPLSHTARWRRIYVPLIRR